jgi:hypothetical protein
MQNVLIIISIVAGIISLATVGGVAFVAVIRASALKATVAELREDIKDRNERIDFLEEADKRKSQELRELRAKNKYLEDLVLLRPEMQALVVAVKDHDENANARHNDVMAMLEQFLRAITEHTEGHAND